MPLLIIPLAASMGHAMRVIDHNGWSLNNLFQENGSDLI